MRVLMLGWEFPPHISGGLGTACLGLTRGLTHSGVEVLFVMPRAYGDEDAAGARVIGANQVDLPAYGMAPELATAELDAWSELQAAAGLAEPGVAVDEALADVATRLRLVAVASPLTPYLTEVEYRARLRRPRRRPGRTVGEHAPVVHGQLWRRAHGGGRALRAGRRSGSSARDVRRHPRS